MARAARAPKTTLSMETVVLVAALLPAAAADAEAAAAVASEEIWAAPVGAKTWGR